MIYHSDATSHELIELTEGAIWPERNHYGYRREVVALAKHLQLHDALQVA